MTCYSPLTAWRCQGGGIVFKRSEGFSDLPLEIQCGQCVGCRMERSRQWAIRCVHEAQLHDRNSYLTLTYAPEFLPPDGGLHIRHWQLFAKRLRKKIGSFRFFHCGEYGEENLRPHYHAAIFGVDFSGDRKFFKTHKGNSLYRSKLLEDAWGLGHCTVGALTYESAAYVARYVMKKVNGPDAAANYERVDPVTGEVFQVRPEYISMSRRPGIAAGWFDKFKTDVFPSDEVIHNGRRFRPPRFYDSRLSESELDSIKRGRRERIAARGSEITPERLRVREACAERKVARLSRDFC